MSALSVDLIRERLSQVSYPGFSRDIVSIGVVSKIEIEQGVVMLRLKLDSEDSRLREDLEARVRTALGGMEELQGLKLSFVSASAGAAGLPVMGQESKAPAAPQPASEGPNATNIIGVASGKGGVGKSTIAVNLAVSLAAMGRRVGFLDADVHGPSAPLMFGMEDQKPEDANAEGKPYPLEAFGVKLMSMGFFVERDNAVIWRGPIVGNFIKQLLTDVDWGELDDLIIDFPPGTGDAQLTISQTLKMTGALVVTTPNDLAIIDALKAVTMFRKVQVPIFGFVENMAHFTCPHCNEQTAIFGHGGVDRAAAANATEVLGRIPIDPLVVRESDSGSPVVRERPNSEAGQAYRSIAARVLELLAAGVASGSEG